MESLKSALLRIDCDPNLNGSSSKNSVAINSGLSPSFRINFKRNLDESENVENKSPKKSKHNF